MTRSPGTARSRSSSGAWPSAFTAMSAGKTKLEPATGRTGLSREAALSGSVRTNSTPQATPFWAMMRNGCANHSKRTPSALASPYS